MIGSLLKHMGVVEQKKFRKAKGLNAALEILAYIGLGLKFITISSVFFYSLSDQHHPLRKKKHTEKKNFK